MERIASKLIKGISTDPAPKFSENDFLRSVLRGIRRTFIAILGVKRSKIKNSDWYHKQLSTPYSPILLNGHSLYGPLIVRAIPVNEQNRVLRLDLILQFVISEAVGDRIFSERFKYNSNLSDKRSLRLFSKIQPKHLVQKSRMVNIKCQFRVV